MAELRPFPFGSLVRRMFHELDARQSIFDLPARKFYGGDPRRDLSVKFQGHRASTALGPAAGPQTQMAQNIVLSWLAGCRLMELKTVQIMDELELPRPCIDVETVGYNVEWSQELKLEESLHEYVGASMLIEMLIASGRIPMAPGYNDWVFDMSVGYDLKGIRSERVMSFINGMRDARPMIDQLRAEIPAEFAQYRDLDYRTELADSLTLSTFHGCPPDEIEQICDYLLRSLGLNTIVKLNPMLLGRKECRGLLNDVLGYTDIHVPETAFEQDATWEQATGFVQRLGDTAKARGLGFGVKFTNTLIVENHRAFFPAAEKEMYLSGAPLHVLAMNLVRRFRETFGDRYPISFSAGIDKANFADAVGIGLVPVTVCTDLLRPGGYGRAPTYLSNLSKRMNAVGAEDIDTFIIRAYDQGEAALDQVDGVSAEQRQRCVAALADGGDLRAAAGDDFDAWVSAARVANTSVHVEAVTADPRYTEPKNNRPPKGIDSKLELFDCITCDKCIPVCPNDANFRLHIEPVEMVARKLRWVDGAWSESSTEFVRLEKKHQIATFADFCNECGNCDVFCPEEGGPYEFKPLFFGTHADWQLFASYDGFFAERGEPHNRIFGRISGQEYALIVDGESNVYSGPDFEVRLEPKGKVVALTVSEGTEVDLTYATILNLLLQGVLADINYVSLR
jgi:putative selenate reductase